MNVPPIMEDVNTIASIQSAAPTVSVIKDMNLSKASSA